MKSLVTTFLVFATCLVIAGTIALIDQAEATLALTSSEATQLWKTWNWARLRRPPE